MHRQLSPRYEAWRLAEEAATLAERLFYEQTLSYFRGDLDEPPSEAQRMLVMALREESRVRFHAAMAEIRPQLVAWPGGD